MIKRIYLSEHESTLAKGLINEIAKNDQLKLCNKYVPHGTLWEQYSELVVTLKEERPDYIIVLSGHSPFEIENLALVSQIIGARVIYLSTPEVFDGTFAVPEATNLVDKEGNAQVRMRIIPYTEYQFPRPVTDRGMNALHGEQYVQRYVRRYAIVRTGYVFNPETMKTIKPKDIIPWGNPIVSPTTEPDLISALLLMIEQGLAGVYHIASNCNEMTILELIKVYQPFVKYDLIQPKQGQQYCHNQMITGTKFHDRTGHTFAETKFPAQNKLKVVK